MLTGMKTGMITVWGSVWDSDWINYCIGKNGGAGGTSVFGLRSS